MKSSRVGFDQKESVTTVKEECKSINQLINFVEAVHELKTIWGLRQSQFLRHLKQADLSTIRTGAHHPP
ncbi:hypothetical protein YC2023_096231 [Brassica napus]